MAKMNYARAAMRTTPHEQSEPRGQSLSGWNDKRSKRRRQIEAWQRARQCLRQANAIPDNEA